jgi:hypothetical protein
MRKIGMKVVLLMLSLGVLLSSFALQAKAQGEGEKATQVYIVPIKNVRAEVMAYWITPRKDAKPVPKTFDKNDRTPYTGVFDLIDFPGIESITATAAKNELLVKGTPEAVQKLKEIIEFLDRPVKQVGIKVWFVEVDATEMAGLTGFQPKASPTKFVAKTSNETNTFVFNNSFLKKFQPLIQSQRAKILQFAQVTTWNNSTAKASWNDNAVTPQMDLEVTPTIQNDDTITIYLTPKVVSKKMSGEILSSQYISTVANVKADDVIVVSTLNLQGTERAVLLLVSAKIISEQEALLN